MADMELIKVVVGVAGAGGLFFVAWYMVNKSLTATTTEMTKSMSAMVQQTIKDQSDREQRNFQMQLDAFHRIIDEQSKREERSYQLLKELLESNQINSAMMSRVEHKIDTHHQCPIVRGELKP
ncbi:MAG: hypothetical protein JXK05_04010 [Campylobacterales bacterium]|nr:hypothetical protein [Campylobacterales bacterium]